MMTNAQLATASLDDIVFDGRNRRYGAYQLRAAYHRHVTRALVIATAVCALLLLLPFLAQLLRAEAPARTVTAVIANPVLPPLGPDDVVPPPAQPAAKPPVQPPQPPTVKDLVPVVVVDKDAPKDDEVPERNELLNKVSGLKTAAGDPDASPNATPAELEPGLEPGTVTELVKEKPYLSVEQMPQLPGGGGTAAIVAAIQRLAKYPGPALHNGVEGKVYVSFTVDAKGEVIDVAIVRGLGSGLDEETVRAIKALPRFIPGRQNGRDVSVSFTVPVTYQIRQD